MAYATFIVMVASVLARTTRSLAQAARRTRYPVRRSVGCQGPFVHVSDDVLMAR